MARKPAHQRQAYNNAGRLRQAYSGTTLKGTYTYNHLGQRTRKVAGTTTTIYHYDIDGNLILETSQTAVTRAAYFYADTNPIGQVRRSGTTDTLVYLHIDHEGTPRLATNTGAVKVWFWEGRAFGDTNPNQNPDGDTITTTVNLRYAGQYRDSETGLFYNWNRYYDPKTGRYLTADPIGLAGGLNDYGYGYQNPLRYIDPNGLDGFENFGFAEGGSVGVGGALDIFRGFGAGGSAGVEVTKCCGSDNKEYMEFVFVAKGGPSFGRSARISPEGVVNIVRLGPVPKCRSPILSFGFESFDIQVLNTVTTIGGSPSNPSGGVGVTPGGGASIVANVFTYAKPLGRRATGRDCSCNAQGSK